MTILVTGGAGFIGGNFVLDWLAQSDEKIINLDKLTYAGNLDSLRSLDGDARHVFVHADIGDRAVVDALLAEHKPRAVLNFAAESHVDRSIHGPGEFIQTNIVGTFNLLESVRAYWGGLEGEAKAAFRFLHVSTDEVYGSLEPQAPAFTERHRYEPNSPYSASKAASDHLVRAYHHTYGLPVLTTNCSNNYGPYHFPEKLIPLVIHNALAGKDASELDSLTAGLKDGISSEARQGLKALLQLYGDEKVLAEAEKALPPSTGLKAALQNLQWLAAHTRGESGEVKVSFDLADLRGYAYYSGTRFAIYGQGAELARGGRYDEVGAVFGRNRPAAGFSLDLKELVSVLPPRPLKAAIRAPWSEDAGLRAAIARLRAGGETVACVLPGHEHEVNEFDCDRELAHAAGQWVVQPLKKAA